MLIYIQVYKKIIMRISLFRTMYVWLETRMSVRLQKHVLWFHSLQILNMYASTHLVSSHQMHRVHTLTCYILSSWHFSSLTFIFSGSVYYLLCFYDDHYYLHHIIMVWFPYLFSEVHQPLAFRSTEPWNCQSFDSLSFLIVDSVFLHMRSMKDTQVFRASIRVSSIVSKWLRTINSLSVSLTL